VVGEGELIESKECPNEGGEDEENVYGGEEVVLEPKLKIGKREIENEVQREWERDRPRERSFFKGLVKNRAKGDGDDGVQYRPHWTKKPRWWRPSGLDERAIPVVCVGVHHVRERKRFRKSLVHPVYQRLSLLLCKRYIYHMMFSLT